MKTEKSVFCRVNSVENTTKNSFPENDNRHIVIPDILNYVNDINLLLYNANKQLPTATGMLTCCFETKSTRKERMLKQSPSLLSKLIYINDFVVRRLLPKLLPFVKPTHLKKTGKYKILPKTEVLGRLCYLGFRVLETRKMNGLTYVLAVKHQNCEKMPPERYYGPFIKLQRIGKMGKIIVVFKLRTMYAYSEFLQEYMYSTYSLQMGGKFKKDIRICTWGKLVRMYFIDELPMLLNLLKGEIKLVGVRPLSAQYLSLYSEELRQLRTEFTPGLLPPFYADMPRTIDEIQQSELSYLHACKTKGIFVTDFQYFFKILINLLVNRAKSI